MDLKIANLKHFVAIANEGQIGRAALRLGISQPALTKSLAALERAVDSQLFRRNRKGVELTLAGELLLARATTLLQDISFVIRELGELAIGSSGHVRLGVGGTLGEWMLPQAMANLRNGGMAVTVNVMTGLNDVLFHRLRNGEVDLVVSGVPLEPSDDLNHEVIAEDEMVLVAATNHRLAGKRRVKLEALARESWILPPIRVLARLWLENEFQRRGLVLPKPVLETDSPISALATASVTDLVSFQSRFTMQLHGLQHRVVELKSDEIVFRRPIGISWRKSARLPRAAQNLLASLSVIGRQSAASPSS